MVKVETDNSNWQAPKTRKKRKPMSEEQRAAAAKRLEKAREKRAEKNPDYGHSGIHFSLRDLPDEHNAHPKKVKQWIKTQKELASAERAGVRQGVKGAVARLANHEGYIRNCQKYLRDGDWVDNFYGEYQEQRVKWRCIAMAYDEKGDPKRRSGTYYPDMGMVYTEEVKGIADVKKERKKRKRSNNSRAVAKGKKKSKVA